MSPTKFAVATLLVPFLALVVACGGGGGGSGGGSSAQPKPTVTVASRAVRAGHTATIDVSASDPLGEPVTIVLQNPPPGGVFTNNGSSVAAKGTLRWTVPNEQVPPIVKLFFKATTRSGRVGRGEIDVLVERSGAGPTVLVGDVTGDGVLDCVALARGADVGGVQDVGAIYVWSGATKPSGTPTATLVVPGAQFGDTLGDVFASPLQLVDVTGDGVLDVVSGTDLADTTAVDDGAFHVWKGGASLTGVVAPIATLHQPNATDLDQLGAGFVGWPLFADVDGDGALDVLIGTRNATVAGVSNAGAIYVWKGGAALNGAPAPFALLAIQNAQTDDQLTDVVGPVSSVQVGDVTGDGQVDVVASTFDATVAGNSSAGAIHVWAGGATLTGVPTPVAVLERVAPAADDELALHGFLLADLDDDGVLDVVSSAPLADVNSVVDAGEIDLWKGGPTLFGTKAPDALLVPPSSSSGDRLGTELQVADVTNDGKLDLVALAEFETVGGVNGAGAVHVFQGGSPLAGTVAPIATLHDPAPTAGQNFGRLGVLGVLFGDVTGDNVVDLVVPSPHSTHHGVADAGALFVWAGGATLPGATGPAAALEDFTATSGDTIGLGATPGVELADVTADGRLDVVVSAPLATVSGQANAGEVLVWRGGATLSGVVAPIAKLASPTPSANDQFGGGAASRTILEDFTGDQVRDLLVSSSNVTVNGQPAAGALLLFVGGTAFSGTPAPFATLTVANPSANDQLGLLNGTQIVAGDVSGDGIADVVTGSPLFDVAGVVDAGELFVWLGGATLHGARTPDVQLRRATPIASDRLGEVNGQSVLLADLTDDGTLDLLVMGSGLEVGGAANAGAILFWRGGPALLGTPLATEFTVPGALADDRLGE
jgi:hypothetical protein